MTLEELRSRFQNAIDKSIEFEQDPVTRIEYCTLQAALAGNSEKDVMHAR